MSASTPNSLEEAAELRRRLRALGHGPTNASESDELEQRRADRVAAGLEAELRRLVRQRARVRIAVGAGLASAAVTLLALGLRERMHDRTTLIAQEELPQAPSLQEIVALPSTPPAAPSSGPPAREPARRGSAPVVVPPASASAGTRSTLGEENRLFQEAAEASRQGDVAASLDSLERLLKEFPQSPLAQTALVRKFRLLAKAGRTADAAREAERYLRSYPTGFAIAEASALQSAKTPVTASSSDAGVGKEQ
jgi:TolA-binding protein